MKQAMKHLALTMACVAAIGASSASFAALPVAGAAPTNTRTVPSAPIAKAIADVGSLQSMTGTPADSYGMVSVEVNTAMTFKFAGSGHCIMTLNTGDGYSKSLDVQLPYEQPYAYNTTSMSSYETFKNYSASVTTSGNCKKVPKGTFDVTVHVTNSHAQSLNGTNSNNTVLLSNAAKLGLAGALTTASAPAPVASVPAGGANIKVK